MILHPISQSFCHLDELDFLHGFFSSTEFSNAFMRELGGPWRKDMGREHTAFKSDREVRNKTGSEGVVCYRPKTNPRSKQRLMAEIRLELENH